MSERENGRARDPAASERQSSGDARSIAQEGSGGNQGVEPRNEAAIEFLQRWAPAGPWALTWFDTDQKKSGGKLFGPGQEEALGEWLSEHNGRHNIYFHVNPLLREPKKGKAEKEDVLALQWLHIDIDPRPGEDILEERARAYELLSRRVPKGLPGPATVIIDSGRGFQGFWRLKEPLMLGGDRQRAEAEAEPYNKQLERLYVVADPCHNVDRIMRLPGTVNLPTKRNKQKGFTQRTLARLEEFEEERVYDLSQFTKAKLTQGEAGGGSSFTTGQSVRLSTVRLVEDVDELPGEVRDMTKVIIVQGLDPDEPGKHRSRSEWLLRVCCDLVRAGCEDEVIAGVILNPDFKISESVLESQRPEKYAARQIERARMLAVDPQLLEMNERHIVIGNYGGGCRVIEEVHDPILDRWRLTHASFADIRNRYMHRKVQVGDDDKGSPRYMPLGKWWLEHEQRRQADRVVFAPGRDVEGAYNLWKGFGCEARPGDLHEKFLAHVRDNICSGDEEHYLYLLGWMARAVQHPDCPGEVAVVLRGRRGTGKGSFARTFGRLFGRHYMQVTSSKHVTGSFNAHLQDCVVLFADEAFASGDKQDEKTLNGLITERHMTVEKKGIDVEASANFLHLIMASNDEWVVPAGEDERRYFVLDVSDAKMQQDEYFRAIEEDLDQGGICHLLHFLQEYGLSQFNVRRVPQTEALEEQKRQSRGVFDEVLEELLPRGDYLIRTADVWDLVGKSDPGRRTQADNRELGRAMRRLGFHKTQPRRLDRAFAYARGPVSEGMKNPDTATLPLYAITERSDGRATGVGPAGDTPF